jgi:hypothetical protein
MNNSKAFLYFSLSSIKGYPSSSTGIELYTISTTPSLKVVNINFPWVLKAFSTVFGL